MGPKRDLKVHVHVERFFSRGIAIRILRVFRSRMVCFLCVWPVTLRLLGTLSSEASSSEILSEAVISDSVLSGILDFF